RIRGLNRIVIQLNKWNEFRKHKNVLGLILIFSTIELVVEALRLILQFKIIGVEITFLQGMFLSTLYFLAWIVAITPGGLGIQEAVVVISAKVIGITPVQSIAATIIGRAILAIVLFTL